MRRTTFDKPSGGGFIIVLGPILVIVGCAVAYFLIAEPLLLTIASRNWVEVSAVVDQSAVESHDGSDSTTYSVSIRYHYSYGGRAYTGDKYELFAGSSSGYAPKQKIVDSLKPGTAITVYVDPVTPGQSVFHRWSWGLIFAFFPLLIVFGGVAATRYGIRLRARFKSRVALVIGARPDWLPAVDHRVEGGLVVLKQTSSRGTSFVILLVISVIWLGAVALMVDSALGILVTLFFGVIGLGLVAATVQQFLAMFNPKIEFILDHAEAWPGEHLSLSWQIRGKVERLKKLTITLVGTESATYRRGTGTTTDRNEFKKAPVYESQLIGPMGSATLHIPDDAMHSFTAPNNSVLWKLRVDGAIQRWPDICDEYSLVIVPRGIPHV